MNLPEGIKIGEPIPVIGGPRDGEMYPRVTDAPGPDGKPKVMLKMFGAHVYKLSDDLNRWEHFARADQL